MVTYEQAVKWLKEGKKVTSKSLEFVADEYTRPHLYIWLESSKLFNHNEGYFEINNDENDIDEDEIVQVEHETFVEDNRFKEYYGFNPNENQKKSTDWRELK